MKFVTLLTTLSISLFANTQKNFEISRPALPLFSVEEFSRVFNPAPLQNDLMMVNVFGDDKRVPIIDDTAPWNSIGRLSNGCTGTLVSAKLVLTNAHCVVTEEGNPDPNLKFFYPNLVKNKCKNKYKITRVAALGTKDYKENIGKDWAILELDESAGDIYGWIGTFDTLDVTTVALAGYSTDYDNGQTATLDRRCAVKKRLDTHWYHDCAARKGSSGGPLVVMNKEKKPFLIAINRSARTDVENESEYSDTFANTAVPVWQFQAKLIELLK